ncbi:MAG: hypothetical protein V1820_01510 [archaeon]
MQWIWLILIAALMFFTLFFESVMTGNFLEVFSFLFLAALLAIILASRDPLIILIALLFIFMKIFKRRPVRQDYDVDSAAYGQNVK